MQPKTVIFIGPQGSGKGTQAKKLTAHLQEHDTESVVLHIETGKIFRALMEEESYMGTRVRELLDEGQPIPDIVTDAIVAEEFRRKYTDTAHITMDGYPRNESQARFFDELLAFYGRTHIVVISLEVSDAVVRERLLARGREDDTEENIKERLRWYREMSASMLTYYTQRPDTNCIHIDASQSLEEVSGAVIKGVIE